MHKPEDAVQQQALEILHELKQALKVGPWQSSRVLMSMRDRLQTLKDQFEHALALNSQNTIDLHVHALKQNSRIVFIALYYAQGNNFLGWHHMLANLNELSLTRPIFENETDVQKAVLKDIDDSGHHAYVSVSVKSEDVLFHEANQGALIRLKEGVLKPENILYFIHKTGKYKWETNSLVKQDD